jgi:hypothetical protein
MEQGTNESLKFGSAAASARNSSQAPLQGGRGGSGVGMGKQSGAGAKKSTARGGGGSDGEGDLSDVTQGSKDDEEDSPPPRGGKVPAILTGKQSAPAAGKALGGANPTNAESFYSTVAEEEDDGDGSRSGSGDSDQAHSPFSKSAGSYTFPAAEGKTGTGSKAARPEEEDEYSLDDFETDANQSPEKSAPGKAATSAHGAKQTEPAAKAVAPSHTVQPPPSHLGSPSPAQKTLTPTSSTSSMHAGPAKSTNLNSVEEIMQRWYTADSDFMHRSLQRISSGETGFTLDEEDVRNQLFHCAFTLPLLPLTIAIFSPLMFADEAHGWGCEAQGGHRHAVARLLRDRVLGPRHRRGRSLDGQRNPRGPQCRSLVPGTLPGDEGSRHSQSSDHRGADARPSCTRWDRVCGRRQCVSPGIGYFGCERWHTAALQQRLLE